MPPKDRGSGECTKYIYLCDDEKSPQKSPQENCIFPYYTLHACLALWHMSSLVFVIMAVAKANAFIVCSMEKERYREGWREPESEAKRGPQNYVLTRTNCSVLPTEGFCVLDASSSIWTQVESFGRFLCVKF